jgi:DNA polymerase V
VIIGDAGAKVASALGGVSTPTIQHILDTTPKPLHFDFVTESVWGVFMPRGGNRKGAGAKPKYNEPTTVMRVPESKVIAIRSMLKPQPKVGKTEVEFFTPSDAIKLRLPLMGSAVSAGFPSPADDFMEARLDLNEHLIRHPAATFYARLGKSADSMIGAGIYPNDIIIVDRSLEAKHGDIVLAVVNGDFTLKRYCVKRGTVTLVSENPAYAPIVFIEGDEMQIWGVVKNSIRNL